MNKYLEVFRLSFKMQMVWRTDVVMTVIYALCRIAAGWIVWSAIFTGKEIVGGFTFREMLTYYLICSFLISVDFSSQIGFELNDLIRDGKFSGHMVTPMDPLRYFCSLVAGETAFHAIFSAIAVFACVAALHVNVSLTTDPARVMIALALAATGLAFMACFSFIMGILTFRFIDINFILHVQSCALAFATGSMVPLSLLPDAAFRISRLLPFHHVIYTPSTLLTGQAGVSEGLSGLVALIAWTALTAIIGEKMYHHLRKKYDGVGI